jgi:hypothetical protein
VGYGSNVYPAAYYCKSLTTGGYNTWYLPASAEMLTMYSNNTALVNVGNGIDMSSGLWSSSQRSAYYQIWALNPSGAYTFFNDPSPTKGVRAVRKSTV